MILNNSCLYRKPNQYEWIIRLTDAIKEANQSPELVQKIVRSNCIENYERLYRNYMNLPPALRTHINTPWQLLVLSGEPAAFIHAEHYLGLNKFSKNNFDENALHLAALSGSEAQVEAAGTLGMGWHCVAKNNNNLLHYAVLSGHLPLVQAMIRKMWAFDLKLPLTNDLGQNILHLAAYTGKIDVVEYILGLQKTGQIDLKIDACDQNQFNPLNYALKKGNIRVINRLQKEMNEMPNQDQFDFGEVASRERPQCTLK